MVIKKLQKREIWNEEENILSCPLVRTKLTENIRTIGYISWSIDNITNN